MSTSGVIQVPLKYAKLDTTALLHPGGHQDDPARSRARSISSSGRARRARRPRKPRLLCHEAPILEVADIFRGHGPAWRRPTPAMRASASSRSCLPSSCRTAPLGGHVEQCEDCAHTRIAYNSCRNRHCPRCQARRPEAMAQPSAGAELLRGAVLPRGVHAASLRRRHRPTRTRPSSRPPVQGLSQGR